MTNLLFHALVGSENPTRACFPFLQAVPSKERVDEVQITLGDAGVVLIRDSVISSVVPVGWPPLKETFERVGGALCGRNWDRSVSPVVHTPWFAPPVSAFM